MFTTEIRLQARANILGVGIHPVNIPRVLQVIDDWIARQDRQYICVTGVHGVMESQRDPGLLYAHNQAGLVVPDGMPLVWVSRIQGYRQVSRVYGPDLMLAVCEHSVHHQYRHYFYGGAPGVPERLSERLCRLFPGLRVSGVCSPPFHQLNDDENGEICQQINQAHPDIIWVGIGAPKQEYWMVSQRGRLEAPVLIGVGAAFDFHAGLKKQAPRWMQVSGLEWFYRLLQEPRRLWRRYLLNNPHFLWLLLQQATGLRSFPLHPPKNPLPPGD